ncbi:MAG TPA: A24 family peptidase [Oligoflexia bacterium]|nr:A24 family peptidase [Oligoflexia bacterium]HMP26820.1 A24 family peptidase [Oligoflexia bacterium]
MLELIVIIFGLIIGSFLTACVYRLPFSIFETSEEEEETVSREEKIAEEGKEQSDSFNDLFANLPIPDPNKAGLTLCYPPRSFCPKCDKQLLWFHNIPVISWLFLKGCCAFCKNPISVRYPITEITSALLAILSLNIFGFTLAALLIYLFSCALLVITLIDYDYYIIPDSISLPGFISGIFLAVLNQAFRILPDPFAPTFIASLIGALVGGGFLFLVSRLYLFTRKREGLGLGDVKLLAMIGSWFGPFASFFTIFIGSLIGSICGVMMLLARGKGISHPIPFGPFLALAAAIYIFLYPYGILNLLKIFNFI